MRRANSGGAVRQGDVELTERQREVLRLIAAGKTNAEIGEALGISLDGAKWHVSEILARLDVSTREEAGEYWRSRQRLRPRLRRLTGALFSATGWKAISIAAALGGLGSAALVLVLLGRGSGATPNTSLPPEIMSATPSSSPAPTTAPTDIPKPAIAPEVISSFPPESLAFIRDGNLWVVDLAGMVKGPGHEVQVTRNGGLSYPLWSFSGRWLTVVGLGKRWLVSTEGELRALDAAVASAAAWSPSEDALAYATTDGVYLFDVASGTSRRLLDTPGDGMAWSPDGTMLAVGNDDHRPAAESLPAPAVTVVSIGNGSAVRLPVAPATGTETIVAGWTSDGRTVLAWINPILSASIRADGVALYAVPLAGGEPLKLGTTLLYRDYVSPRPGRTGVVALVDGGFRTAWDHKSLAIAQAFGGDVPFPRAVQGAVAAPAWSRDGSRIAYVAGPELPGVGGGDEAKAGLMQRRIWVQPATGGEPAKLADDTDYRDEHPQWGGDTCVLFARIDRSDKATLWLADANDGSVREKTGVVSFPASPGTTWFGYYGHIAWDAMYDWWPAHDYQSRTAACQTQ